MNQDAVVRLLLGGKTKKKKSQENAATDKYLQLALVDLKLENKSSVALGRQAGSHWLGLENRGRAPSRADPTDCRSEPVRSRWPFSTSSMLTTATAMFTFILLSAYQQVTGPLCWLWLHSVELQQPPQHRLSFSPLPLPQQARCTGSEH